VIALPIDECTAPYEVNDFIGGGLTFWDGPKQTRQATANSSSTHNDDDYSTNAITDTTATITTNEIHYDTRSGDIAFIDRYVECSCVHLHFDITLFCSATTLVLGFVIPNMIACLRMTNVYALSCYCESLYFYVNNRAVWHQADPITKGTRWALVIFYKVEHKSGT
jgi:hypothetical protein